MSYTVGQLDIDPRELVGDVFPDEVIIKARKNDQDLMSLTISKKEGRGMQVSYRRSDDPFERLQTRWETKARETKDSLVSEAEERVKERSIY